MKEASTGKRYGSSIPIERATLGFSDGLSWRRGMRKLCNRSWSILGWRGQGLKRTWITSMARLVSTAAVFAAVLSVGCSSRPSSDADWEEVQKAATRVESGLKHETLIALR